MGEDDVETLTLRPRRLKLALYGGLMVAFTVIGVSMIRDGDRGGWFVAGFCGACALFFIALLLPGAADLDLTHDGFHIRSLWRTHFTPWSAVAGFGVARVGGRRLVVFNFVDANARRGARFARILTGVEGALPDTYGMSAENLARLMNAWRERALAAPGSTRVDG